MLRRSGRRAPESDVIGDQPRRSREPREPRPDVPRGPGLPSWAALLVLVVIAGLSGIVDGIGGSTLKGVFAIGLIVGALVAIVLVRRREMFPVIIAPPLIYFGASAVLLYARSGGLHDRSVLIDSASNWLVYGFPAIAGASAVVLLVAGIRIIARR
jgi:Gpi18-like mannosyltransferase